MNLTARRKLQTISYMTNTLQNFVRTKEFMRELREGSVYHSCLCKRLELEKNLINHMENTVCTVLVSLGLNSVLSSLQM
jgi:hypothetical protein